MFISCVFCLFFLGSKPDISAVIQQPHPVPVLPGHPVTLQCSVFSDCEKSICPIDHMVYWFKTVSDQFHPNLIYVDGKSEKVCPEAHNCVYSFSKIVSPSDAGTYYCAVASNEEIIFGNGTQLNVEGMYRTFLEGWDGLKNVSNILGIHNIIANINISINAFFSRAMEFSEVQNNCTVMRDCGRMSSCHYVPHLYLEEENFTCLQW